MGCDSTLSLHFKGVDSTAVKSANEEAVTILSGHTGGECGYGNMLWRAADYLRIVFLVTKIVKNISARRVNIKVEILPI